MEQKPEIIIYRTPQGSTKIDVRLVNETVWLTQKQLAVLFQTTVPNINMHIKNILEEGELEANRTIQDFLIVQKEGTRGVERSVEHYNLDMVISVGYRIKSHVATQFRIWATNQLKEFIIKGFVLDDERYKFHWAIHGHTAAEVLLHRADATKLNMGFTQHLEFAELQALSRNPMHMQDWITKLHGFLTLNEKEILMDAGKVSAQLAKEHVHREYGKYKKMIEDTSLDEFDKASRRIESKK